MLSATYEFYSSNLIGLVKKSIEDLGYYGKSLIRAPIPMPISEGSNFYDEIFIYEKDSIDGAFVLRFIDGITPLAYDDEKYGRMNIYKGKLQVLFINMTSEIINNLELCIKKTITDGYSRQ